MIKDLPFDEYLKHEGVSASDIVNFSRTPRDFIRTITREQTPAMRLGSLVHTLVLEPKKFNECYVVEPSNLPDGTSIRKAAKDGSMRKTTEGKAYLESFLAENESKTFITQDELNDAYEMRDAVFNNKKALALLEGLEIEKSLFWKFGDLPCKGRPDGYKQGVLIDLKTTRDIEPKIFEAESYRRKYHQKQAWYKWALEKNDIEIEEVKLVVVSRDECIVRPMARELIDRGLEANMRALDKLLFCIKENTFPTWDEEIPLGLPPWATIDLRFEGEI